jgi:hypothetical protein
VKTIQVGAEASQTTRIGGNLGEKQKSALIVFLRANVDMFA